jgi:hypothetical protein
LYSSLEGKFYLCWSQKYDEALDMKVPVALKLKAQEIIVLSFTLPL